jgi:hypothetical protein
VKQEIRAIETRYKGYRFRSRLEARWAVFFETAGIKWQYEVEGFETPFGRYLPDFYLPEIRNGLWVEVKPPHTLAGGEWEKLESVVIQTKKDAVIVREIPGPGLDPYRDFGGVDDGSAWWIIGPQDAQEHGHSTWSDGAYVFCVCPNCGKLGFEFDGRGDRVCGVSCKKFHKGKDRHGDKGYSCDFPILAKAYDKARSARFEHGETP